MLLKKKNYQNFQTVAIKNSLSFARESPKKIEDQLVLTIKRRVLRQVRTKIAVSKLLNQLLWQKA